MGEPRWQPNPGHCPEEAKGKRIRVVLEKDKITMTEPVYANALTPTCAPGWAADGREGCNWARSKSPFSIAFWSLF